MCLLRRGLLLARLWLPVLLLGFAPVRASAQEPRPIPPSVPLGAAPGLSSGDATVSQVSRAWDPPAPGRSCNDYTFEGNGDWQPVPPLDGMNFPGWYTIVDYDAGGSITGIFANEPSPSTAALFWPNAPQPPSGQLDTEIVFNEPVSEFSFYFAAGRTVYLYAYDENNHQIALRIGLTNIYGGVGDPTGDYNKWDPLRIIMPGNQIKRIVINAYSDFTFIDDLRVCRNIEIVGVEFTQAVQQYQNLDDLRADLAADGQPPVPIVARKPMAVRVYVNELNKSEDLRVWVAIGGTIRLSNLQSMQINCSPAQQRLGSSLDFTNTCRSLDVVTIPPENSWSITVELLNDANDVLDQESFDLTSLSAETLNLAVSTICLRRNAAWPWTCSDPTQVPVRLNVLERIVPTDLVTVRRTDTTIAKSCDTLDDNDDGVLDGDIDTNFWSSVTDDLASARTWDEALLELSDIVDTRGFGLVPTAMNRNTELNDNCRLESGGMASDVGGRGAATLDQVLRYHQSVDTTVETVAHEIGHMLNAEHTEKEDNYETNAPPGCYNVSFSQNPAANPFTGEVGYDVWDSANPIRPSYDVARNVGNFDIMSYCSPRWVSVRSYLAMLNALQVGTGSPVPFDAPPPYYGQFWKVSGVLHGAVVNFDPLFQVDATGSTDPGAGDYQLQVLGVGGTVLFSRAFTPVVANIEESSALPITIFSELLPVQTGAVDIVLLDSTSTIIGTISLIGAAPVVDILTSPSGTLSGEQVFTWTVTDPDSATHKAWVQYSPNGDAQGEWLNLITDLDDDSLAIDFSQLPGSAGNGWVRVYVSDGVNTGSDIVGPFSVPFKQPYVEIQNPVDGAYLSGNGVTLAGGGYDTDDGYLDDAVLQWTSNVDGTLGSGHVLALSDLSEGTRTVTLTGQDSGGNSSDSSPVTFTVDRTPPELELSFTEDSNPPHCVTPIVTTSDALSGLERVQYSQDGGMSWLSLPIALLDQPYAVPPIQGTGYFHVVVSATDRAGNIRSRDGQFFVGEACDTAGSADMVGTVLLQGRPTPPDTLDSVSLHMVVLESDSPTQVANFFLTVSETGEAPVMHFLPGTYRFWLKHNQSLAILQQVPLVGGTTQVDFGMLRMGDADNNNTVTILDFAILAAAFGKTQGQTGYDARADFNGDGAITILDFSLLASNFGQAGASLPS